ncbi:unnamed protein product [Parajaminaea phylloscopi]
MSNPSQGYKIPESAAGSGQTGLSGQSKAVADGGRQPETLQEEMGVTLGNNFNLANTKAETKGEENLIPNPEANNTELNTLGSGGDKIRQPVHSHDIDMPANAPHLQGQSNESSKPLGSNPLDTGKPQV